MDRTTDLKALYKSNTGVYRTVEILLIDLEIDSIRIGWRFSHLSYCMKEVSYDRVVPWNESLVGKPW